MTIEKFPLGVKEKFKQSFCFKQPVSVNGLLLPDQGPGPGFFEFESEIKQTLVLAVCRSKMDADGQPVSAKPHWQGYGGGSCGILQEGKSHIIDRHLFGPLNIRQAASTASEAWIFPAATNAASSTPSRVPRT
jgi:hypothetical protein